MCVCEFQIPICAPKEARLLASLYKEQGFRFLKTKIGGSNMDDDIERLLAIQSGHPDCSLIVDANCGYREEDSRLFLKKCQEKEIQLILFEQPVLRNDCMGLKALKQMQVVKVAADESCRSAADALRIGNGQLADVINIKLAKLGVLGALETVRVAKHNDIGLMMGGMVETRLGMGFAAHFAGGVGGFSFVDLDTPMLMAEDPVVGGCQICSPQIVLGDVPGLGCTVPLPSE